MPVRLLALLATTAAITGAGSLAASPSRDRADPVPAGRGSFAENLGADDPRRTTTSLPLAGEPDLRVTLERGKDLLLLARARPGDSYQTLAARLLEPGMPAALLTDFNPGRRSVQGGSWYRIPVAMVSAPRRAAVLRVLFPADGPCEAGWAHVPSASPLDTYGEGAWEAAVWFTGRGGNFETILRVNHLSDPILPRGKAVVIPASMLLAPFRRAWEERFGAPTRSVTVDRRAAPRGAAPAPDAGGDPEREGLLDDRDGDALADGDREASGPADLGAGEETPGDRGGPAPPATASRPGRDRDAAAPELVFAKDSEGEYASYRLRSGEALYSSVVVRFTGRIDPEEVSAAAAIIAKRSGIREVTGIPAGRAVKIPRDLLLPEFLPAGDRLRADADARRNEAERVRNPVRSRNLEGIHVILDAGHGGVDPGALVGGVAEHEYVYDIMCRAKRILEAETAAVVHPLIEDRAAGFLPRSGRTLPVSGGEAILTTPAHVNGDTGETSLGVNLRWYLANSIQRRLLREGVPSSRIVFASLHADVLHPSLRGAMVYVPAEQYRRGWYACGRPECARYGEVRESPMVHYPRSERIVSEGLSREFARALIAAFRARGIRVHPDLPIRDRIIRRGRAWIPAVLRGNGVPVKVLIETGNLNNAADRALIRDPAFRESVARAFAGAMLDYYKARPAEKANTVRVRAGQGPARRGSGRSF